MLIYYWIAGLALFAHEDTRVSKIQSRYVRLAISSLSGSCLKGGVFNDTLACLKRQYLKSKVYYLTKTKHVMLHIKPNSQTQHFY
jgi:hypothetical protein